jgi:hypothetical protein
MITVILSQGEVDEIYGCLDQCEMEYGLYIKEGECDCPLFPHGHGQKHDRACIDRQTERGIALHAKFRNLASEGA